MVFQTDLFLFQTPLDPQYSNVFDDYQSNDNYFVFLEQAFPHIHILLPSGMFSRKNIGDRFELVIQHYDSVDLENYNYLTFKDQNGLRRYAFITEIESLNDDQSYSETYEWKTTCSCKLYCELDVWANNYLTIKDNYNSINERRCTFDTAVWRNYPSAVKNRTLSEKVVFDSFIPQYSGSDEKLIPLWQRIEVSDVVSPLGDSSHQYTNASYLKSGINTLYKLQGILKINSLGEMEYIRSFKFKRFDLDRNDFYTTTHGTESDMQDSVYSDEAISNTITTDFPAVFKVYYDADDGYYHVDLDDGSQGNVANYPEMRTINVVSKKDGSTIIADGLFQTSHFRTPQSTNCTAEINRVISTSQLLTYASTNRYSTAYVGQNEQIMNEYPFVYYSLKIGSNVIPLIGDLHTESFILRYNCTKNTSAYLYKLNTGDTTQLIDIQNHKYLPISNRPVDDYLSRNQNGMLYKIATATFSLASGNPSQMIGVGGDFARFSDLMNQSASVRVGGSSALSIPIPDDCIVLCKHTAYSPEKIIQDYHENGYECFYIGSIFEKRRDCFDIDTGELTLTAAISDGERKKLKEAFARGVCRWHIGDAYQTGRQARRNIIKALNRKVFNYPISLIP